MTGQDATPLDLLAAAREVLEDSSALWGTSWGRAAAFLARQALEQAVAGAWAPELAELASASFADQFACLRALVGEQQALGARQAWSALCVACHAHPYELAPALAEVTDLLEAARNAVTALQVARVPGASSSGG